MADDSVYSDAQCTYVLLTGANTGLGLATCRRLIDEFLDLRPASQNLHLIVTCRSTQKSSATISCLRQHLHRTSSRKRLAADRVTFAAYELDLTSLPAVLRVGQAILSEIPRLDALICNAGLAGWTGIDWLRGTWLTLTDLVEATTWPVYLKDASGLKARPQLPPGHSEPPLGEIFCANVFGHYLLVHILTPLLVRSPHPGRVIMTSSVEALGADFNLNDMQCLGASRAYGSSKRLTDILVLTSSLRSTSPSLSTFFSASGQPASVRPNLYLAHPGICSTEIMPLHPFVAAFKKTSFYLARMLGSPWHTITTYKAAVAPVWLTLTPQSTIDAQEERYGKGKWGSSTDWWGRERVMRTEVEGWGWGGKVGEAGRGWSRKGRKRGARDLTESDREGFERLGAEVWSAMEKLRIEWGERLKEARII